MMMIEDGNLCLLLAIEGLMAMIESPHFKTTFASLNNVRDYNCFIIYYLFFTINASLM